MAAGEEMILVSTQVLTAKRTEWQELCSKIRGAFYAGIEEIKKIDTDFQAKPVSVFLQKTMALSAQGEKTFERLSRHIAKLSEITAIYEATEKENINGGKN